MANIVLYNHGGSENHGCEALVRTASALLGKGKKVKLISDEPAQDLKYGIQNIANITKAAQSYSRLSSKYIQAYLKLKKSGDYFDMDALPYLKPLEKLNSDDIAVSIGGDNYCYEFYPKFIRIHQSIVKRGIKTVLLGCSLEKELFDDKEFVDDVLSYDYITARESLTYGYLKESGVKNVSLIPDSAFTLPVEKLPLPENFIEGNMVGINVSPLVERKEKQKGIVFVNFKSLIQYIIDNTDRNIALIPHVVWEGNDDREILNKLYNEFADTNRVVLIDDYNCMQLKGYISRCRFFVGARTHATIAAYSTGVPTLVLGYSVKSRGIAKDIFGTDENYVVSVESLDDENKMTKAFKWLESNEEGIRKRLNVFMTEYVDKAKEISNLEKMIYGAD